MADVREEEVQLIGLWYSPFAMRVKLALSLKGVEYQNLEEQNTWDKSELLLKSNPIYKKSPILFHRGHPLCESMIIVQYIDEEWRLQGNPILPAGRVERAEARFWVYYVDDKLYPSLRNHVAATEQEDKEKAAAEAAAALHPLEKAFETASKGKPFFGGDDIGFIDIALGCFLPWIRALQKLDGIQILSDNTFPNLSTWAQNFSAHDAAKEVLPDNDKMPEVIRIFRALFSAA